MAESGHVRAHLTSLVLVSFIAGCGSAGGPTPGPDAAGGGGDAGPTVVTYAQVKEAVFAKKCVPCHSKGGIGAALHTLADDSSSANQPSMGTCPGKKIGECTIVVVKSGFMPFMKGCSGDPAKDSGNAACLTASEQKLLEDWVAGGLQN